jgi:hypothetical protein
LALPDHRLQGLHEAAHDRDVGADLTQVSDKDLLLRCEVLGVFESPGGGPPHRGRLDDRHSLQHRQARFGRECVQRLPQPFDRATDHAGRPPIALGDELLPPLLGVGYPLSPALVQGGQVRIELAPPTIRSPLREGTSPNEPADGGMIDPEGPRDTIL